MPGKRTRPAPEHVKLEHRQKAKDIVSDHRYGKPNLGAEIERALIAAWKAGRDAAEAGEADLHVGVDQAEDAPVPKAKLGQKTKAVLDQFGICAYDIQSGENREKSIFWYSKVNPLTKKKIWYLGALNDTWVIKDSKGDASLQACVKLGLFTPGQLIGQDDKPLDQEILVATQKTRATYLGH